jgi:hypothetical protein
MSHPGLPLLYASAHLALNIPHELCPQTLYTLHYPNLYLSGSRDQGWEQESVCVPSSSKEHKTKHSAWEGLRKAFPLFPTSIFRGLP